MKRTLTALTTATIASSVLLMPAAAHADDGPIPGPETDPCGIVWRDREITYLRTSIDEQREAASTRELAVLGRALLAEDRADELTAQVAARTTERDRAEARASRAARTVARLQAKVAELRARLRHEPVG